VLSRIRESGQVWFTKTTFLACYLFDRLPAA
jgi:hypothetical protein